MAESIKEGVVFILLSLGITFGWNIFLGGLFLAFGFALITREFSVKLRATPRPIALATTALVSTLAAIAQANFMPSLSTQLVMAIAGAIAVPLASRFASRSDSIVDNLINRVAPDESKND